MKNTEALTEASREVSLDVNTEKTKYKVMSRHQNAEQNYDLMTANKYTENVAKFQYLGMIVTHQICIHGEIKRILNSGNVCYRSVQSLLSSRLLSKNLQIKMYESFILWVLKLSSTVERSID
jgi:hypothetical protein